MARSPLDRDLRRAASTQLLGAFAIGGILLGIGALGSTVAVPRLHAAGGAAAASALVAVIGTGLTAMGPLAALAAAFAAASSWSARGGAAGAASLGIGPGRQFVALTPVWAIGAVAVLVFGFALEPAAWTSLHRVRGGPLAAAVGWASLQAGEVRTLGAGGAAVLGTEGLHATTADRGWDLAAAAATPAPDGVSWELSEVTLTRGAQTWTVDAAQVRMKEEGRVRWLAPPSSPWTMGLGPLLRARADSPKAALVLHRRFALAAALPLLAALGWLLAWAEAPSRRRAPRLLGAVVVALTLFVVARNADRAVADGLLSGAVAGWLPLVPAAAVVSALSWRAR